MLSNFEGEFNSLFTIETVPERLLLICEFINGASGWRKVKCCRSTSCWLHCLRVKLCIQK